MKYAHRIAVLCFVIMWVNWAYSPIYHIPKRLYPAKISIMVLKYGHETIAPLFTDFAFVWHLLEWNIMVDR